MEVKVYLFYGIVLVPLVQSELYEYHFINSKLDWFGAQQYCREKYTDLATVESAAVIDRMGVLTNVSVWIGLFDDPGSWKGVMTTDSNSWIWSATGTASTSRYQNWAVGEPNNSAGKEYCVFNENGFWKDYFCTNSAVFVCYTVQSGLKEFVLVNTSVSWAASLAYCRQNYQDLAMIENAAENQAVLEFTQGRFAWTGLSRKPWRWSDNSNSSFRNWASGEPNYSNPSNYCASQNATHLWAALPCTTLLPFVCHRVLNRGSMSKIQIRLQSSADLTDPAINNQLLKQIEEKLESSKNRTGFTINWSLPPTKH